MKKKVEVTLQGISPLLMHSYPMIAPEKGWEKWEPDKQAEIAAYRTPDKQLYVPGVAVQRALVNGATFSKGKGRATLQKQVAACVIVWPEYLILNPQTYDIDSRPVVIAATKGRIVRHRPRFNDWQITCTMELDTGLISEKELRQIVDDTGSRVGLLDFRPEKKGPFGRFTVTQWQ